MNTNQNMNHHSFLKTVYEDSDLKFELSSIKKVIKKFSSVSINSDTGRLFIGSKSDTNWRKLEDGLEAEDEREETVETKTNSSLSSFQMNCSTVSC